MYFISLVTKKVNFSLPMCTKMINYGLVKTFVKPLFIFWIIFFIRFGTKVYRQTVGIPVGTNCAPVVANLFLLCYERDFMNLFGKELFILFAASAFRKLSSIYVFSYFPFGFEGRIWDLTVSVPDHCLSFYFAHGKIRLTLLRLSVPLPDTLMTY